jgi:hypothetical protein
MWVFLLNIRNNIYHCQVNIVYCKAMVVFFLMTKYETIKKNNTLLLKYFV